MVGKKKRVVRRKSNVKAKVVKPSVNSQTKVFSSFKLGVVFRDFILFALLFLICYILYVVSTGEIFPKLFELLWIIFAFIGIAFFFALLVLLFLKWIRK
jgi:uncharacterized Tic20 family protein